MHVLCNKPIMTGPILIIANQILLTKSDKKQDRQQGPTLADKADQSKKKYGSTTNCYQKPAKADKCKKS